MTTTTSTTNTTCYRLADPRTALQESIESYKTGMIGAYAGFGGGFVLLVIAAWCAWPRRRHPKDETAAATTKTTPRTEHTPQSNDDSVEEE